MTTNQQIAEKIGRLEKRVEQLEREWLEEHRIIEILVAAGFVTQAKVAEARKIVTNFP